MKTTATALPPATATATATAERCARKPDIDLPGLLAKADGALNVLEADEEWYYGHGCVVRFGLRGLPQADGRTQPDYILAEVTLATGGFLRPDQPFTVTVAVMGSRWSPGTADTAARIVASAAAFAQAVQAAADAADAAHAA